MDYYLESSCIFVFAYTRLDKEAHRHVQKNFHCMLDRGIFTDDSYLLSFVAQTVDVPSLQKKI